MADVKFPNAEQAAREMADWWASQTRLTFDAKQPRVGIRATWKKVGDGWTPTGHRIQKVRQNYRATGNLINSVQPYFKSISDFGIGMADYGEHIRNGRQPMGLNKGGKGIPLNIMEDWTKTRGIKATDPATGMFIKQTESNKKAMRFLMNRKIKFFGIQGFDFIGQIKEYVLERYNPILEEALGKDIDAHILSNKKIVKK